MKDRYLIMISIFVVVIQSTLIPFWDIVGVHPSLALVFLIASTVVFGHWKGLRLALYLGVLLDILMGKGIGVYVVVYLIISYFISSLEEKIFKDNFITPIILIVCSSTLDYVVFLLFKYFGSGYFTSINLIILQLIIYSIYNIVIGLPIYILLMRRFMGYSVR